MNPGNQNPYNPLDNTASTNPLNTPPNNGPVIEPLMPQISPVPENPNPNFGSALPNNPNPEQPIQANTAPNNFPENNTQLPRPEVIPTAFGSYSPETVQNQSFNSNNQQQPSQLPQTVDPNTMFNPSTNYPPRQDLMGMPPEMPHASANTTSASGKKVKLILVACGVFMLIVLIIVGIIIMTGKSDNKKTSSSKDNPASSSNSNNESKAIVATSLSDFDKGCEGSPISNAASYEGASPHKISLFEESTVSKGSYSRSYVDITDPTWEVDSKDFESTQLLGCLKIKSSTETGKTCEFDEFKNVKLYDTVYELKIIEAKTNKELTTKTINGPAGDCPFVVSINKADPKVLGKPDKGSVNQAIKEYVTK